MKIQNIRVETFDNDQTMILCDVVKYEDKKQVIIKDVAEYIVLTGETYELEETYSNLGFNEDRISQEEIYYIKSVFYHLVKHKKSIEEIEQAIEVNQKNYNLKRLIMMYAECSKLIALGHEKNQNCDRLIETLDYIDTAINKAINTVPYLSLSTNKINEYELDGYRSETYDNNIALCLIEEEDF